MAIALCGLEHRAAAKVSSAGDSASRDATDGFSAFWSAYRRAVVSANKQALAALTNFPLEARWGNASVGDPSTSYDRSKFSGVVDRFLSLPSSRASGEQTHPLTMRDLIAATEHVTDDDSADGEVVLDKFQFRRLGRSWRWVSVFTDDPTLVGGAGPFEVTRNGSVYSQILRAVAQRVPLAPSSQVRHVRRTGPWAYFEALQAGPPQKTIYALLNTVHTPEGHTTWAVKELVTPTDAEPTVWPQLRAKIIDTGVPKELFAGQGGKGQ